MPFAFKRILVALRRSPRRTIVRLRRFSSPAADFILMLKIEMRGIHESHLALEVGQFL